MLEVAESDLKMLDAGQLRELARLYRLVTLDLASHQRRQTTGPTLPFLNALVLRGHRVIYARTRPKIRWVAVWELIARDFPQMLMAERRLFAVTTLIFTLSVLGGYAAMASDPAWVRTLFPQLMTMLELQGYGNQVTPSALASGNIGAGEEASASAFITTNNIRVSILCYGVGAMLGLGTLYFLTMNGAMLGVVSWFYLTRDASFAEYFYAGILPHGVWELTAIVISATAGLMLGRAVIFPGDLPRTQSLREAGIRTLPLVGGVVLMLIVAGFIEGFVTPSKLDSVTKMAVGIGSGVAFWIYVVIAGRPKNSQTALAP